MRIIAATVAAAVLVSASSASREDSVESSLSSAAGSSGWTQQGGDARRSNSNLAQAKVADARALSTPTEIDAVPSRSLATNSRLKSNNFPLVSPPTPVFVPSAMVCDLNLACTCEYSLCACSSILDHLYYLNSAVMRSSYWPRTFTCKKRQAASLRVAAMSRSCPMIAR
jgi:hypothetical protein